MKGLKFWLNNARKIALPQSALPCLTAIVLSIGQDGFCWLFAIPVFLGVCAAHLGMNLADDLFDYRKGLPSGEIRSTLVAEGSVRARMEKCAYILSGEATEKDLRRAVILFLGFAGLMGLGVVAGQFFMNGPGAATAVAAYALGGLILGIEYSGAPLRLGYHGLGEVVIGLIFGPLNILGTAAAMTGTAFRADLLLFSLGVGCLVTNIVYVHSVMETGADRRLGKFTFAHLLRSNTSRTAAVALLALLPFVFLAADILFFDWSPWFLLTLATVPMSLSLVLSTWKFVNGKPRKDIPRWWMGPMGDWKAAVDAGLDWFLFRWLLARNIDTFFCLTVIIVHICLVI
ncbi:MAG: prenyltransferase [Bacteroidales bacterium]|nr:prenyltransferase [Bacteroidales bacterium]